jgi:PST family polysaccharide transporter
MFATYGMAYLIRIIVLRNNGFEAAGFYQAAWTLGGLYVGVILEAMGADFYPRLSAQANDNDACNRLINEQTEVGLLLAGPGVIATMTLSPLVISIFYSAKFAAAVGILRWMCLGALLQVVTWPLGYMVAAKGKQTLYFVCQLMFSVFSVCSAWICIRFFGLTGVGIAFLASNIFHGLMLLPMARSLSKFSWSESNWRIGLSFLSACAFAFTCFYLLSLRWATGIGALITIGSTFYSTRRVITLIPISRFPKPFQSLLRFFKPA